MKTSRKNKKQPRRMQFETLEPRQVLAAGVTASLNSIGVLHVVGTDSDDQILFRQVGKYISISGIVDSWSGSKVRSIVVDLKGGDDFVSLASPSNGGNKSLKEAVTIKSGSGNEQVRLANHHNVNFSGEGHTLFVTSKGKATLDGAVLNLTNKTVVKYRAGVLSVTATNGDDHLAFRQTNGKIYISNVAKSWSAKKVKAIVVYLQDGNDVVSFDSLANGGNEVLNEAITVKSGEGNETVRLANGHDVNFSGLGHTLHIATDGTVTLDGQVLNWDEPTPPPPPPPTNWFDDNIQDAALRTLGSSLYVDGLINRSDILSLFNSAEDGSVVDATELADLRRIVDHTPLFGSDHYLQTLTSYVAYGTVANTNYQGSQLGNLVAGSSSTHLDKLVNKWFLGLDRPVATGTYQPIAGTLFVNGAQYSDVNQGQVGDCYFLAALAETALRENSTIISMFTVNGDGTYGVRFKNPSGQNFYVTVDSYLPTSGGLMVYAHVATDGSWTYSSTNELWVALAEKAYAQLNEFGWSRAGLIDGDSISGQNTYAAIAAGYISDALTHVTGKQTSWRETDTDFDPSVVETANYNFTNFVNSFNAGSLIGFASFWFPTTVNAAGVVREHAYAVVGYNAGNQTVTLFNPWGLNNGSAPGVLTMTWSQVQQNFAYFDYTV